MLIAHFPKVGGIIIIMIYYYSHGQVLRRTAITEQQFPLLLITFGSARIRAYDLTMLISRLYGYVGQKTSLTTEHFNQW